jgi:hypothetical protein
MMYATISSLNTYNLFFFHFFYGLVEDLKKEVYLIPKNSRPIFDPTNIKVKPIRDTLEWSGIVL